MRGRAKPAILAALAAAVLVAVAFGVARDDGDDDIRPPLPAFELYPPHCCPELVTRRANTAVVWETTQGGACGLRAAVLSGERWGPPLGVRGARGVRESAVGMLSGGRLLIVWQSAEASGTGRSMPP